MFNLFKIQDFQLFFLAVMYKLIKQIKSLLFFSCVSSTDYSSLAPPVGSKSDGQKSPSDSVFLRMDDIPYIREKKGTGG